jgi:hypothetical protein
VFTLLSRFRQSVSFSYLCLPQITALPTVLAIRDGEVVSRFTGAIPEPKVLEFLQSV